MSSDLGPLPLPVRHHRGGGGPGEPARLVHAHADDERAAAARARGARRRTAADDGRRSRARLLRAGSTAATRGCSRWRMRPPLARWSLVAVAVIALAVPLYGLRASRSTCPSDVDEARVRGRASPAPRAPSLAAMDEAMQRDRRATIAPCPGVRPCSPRRAAASSARVNQGDVLRAHRAARGAHVHASRGSGAGLRHGDPLAAFRGNYTPARRDAGGPAAARASSATCASAVRNIPSLQHRRRQLRHRLRRSAGPTSSTLARVRARSCARAPSRAGRHRRRRHHAQARQARAARRASTASARPTSASTPSDDRHRAAPHGRRRRARSRASATRRINEDYDVQLRLERDGPRRPRDDLAALRAAPGRARGPTNLVRLDNVVRIEPGSRASRIDRSTASARSGCAPASRPATRSADRIAALRGAVAEMNLPAGYTHRDLGPRPRARAHLRRVPLGVPALGRSSCT